MATATQPQNNAGYMGSGVAPIGAGMGDQNAAQIFMAALGGGQQDTSKSKSSDTSTPAISKSSSDLLRNVLTVVAATRVAQAGSQGMPLSDLAQQTHVASQLIDSVGANQDMSIMPKDITSSSPDNAPAMSMPNGGVGNVAGQPVPMAAQPGTPTAATNSPDASTPDAKDTMHMVNAPHAWTTGGFDEKGNPYDTGAGIKILTLLAGGGWQSSAEGASKISQAASTLLDTLTKKAGLAAGGPQAGVNLTKQQAAELDAQARQERAAAKSSTMDSRIKLQELTGKKKMQPGEIASAVLTSKKAELEAEKANLQALLKTQSDTIGHPTTMLIGGQGLKDVHAAIQASMDKIATLSANMGTGIPKQDGAWSASEFKEGIVYKDGKGNKAKYEGGSFKEVQ